MRHNDVNSKAYWDQRFAEDWVANHGPDQSAFFTRITIARLPAWFLATAQQRAWTLVDWGCAHGDGTAAWAPTIAPERLVGVDFSPVAVATARTNHPGVAFHAEDWLTAEVSRQYDVVYSSNTLEHFREPMDVLAKVCRHATKAVVLTVPYREHDRPSEHFVSFTPDNIPTILPNGMRLVWARVMDSDHEPHTRCTGEQVMLLYVADAVSSLITNLAATLIEHDDAAGAQRELASTRARAAQSERWEMFARQAQRDLEAKDASTEVQRARDVDYIKRLEARVRLLEQRLARKLSTRAYRWFNEIVRGDRKPPPSVARPTGPSQPETPAAPRPSVVVASPTGKPRIDIVNVNFFDWDGEVLYKGGAERYVFDLATMLRRDGWDARILQRGNRAFEKEYRGVPVIGVAMTGGTNPTEVALAYRDVSNADLIIASPAELGTPLGRPSIGINHGIYWDRGVWGQVTKQQFAPVMEALAANAATVAVDTNFINWSRTLDHRLADKIQYVPNYWSADEFASTPKAFDGRLRILFPRRLYRPRGIHLVMDAFRVLLPHHPEVDLHLVGQADADDTLLVNAFIAECGDGRVLWEERAMEDMHEVYATSHIALIPTVYSEGTSLSCLEAMATNNAIVATNVGGLPNLVVDGHNGRLINPSVPDLIGAVESLVSDRRALAEMAARGVTMAQAFEKQKWLARWRRIVHDVCLDKRVRMPDNAQPTRA